MRPIALVSPAGRDDGGSSSTGARRVGGSVLQRTQVAITSPAAAKERRLLGSRFMHQGAREDITTKKESQKSMREKWREGWLAFKRYDAEFRKLLNGAAGMTVLYYVIKAKMQQDKK